MTMIRQIHETALHLLADARKAELPGYAEKMIHAADELEKRAIELERKCASEQTH